MKERTSYWVGQRMGRGGRAECGGKVGSEGKGEIKGEGLEGPEGGGCGTKVGSMTGLFFPGAGG